MSCLINSVCFSTGFSFELFIFKALHGSAPSDIASLLRPHTASKSLKSPDQLLLSIIWGSKAQSRIKGWRNIPELEGGARFSTKQEAGVAFCMKHEAETMSSAEQGSRVTSSTKQGGEATSFARGVLSQAARQSVILSGARMIRDGSSLVKSCILKQLPKGPHGFYISIHHDWVHVCAINNQETVNVMCCSGKCSPQWLSL